MRVVSGGRAARRGGVHAGVRVIRAVESGIRSESGANSPNTGHAAVAKAEQCFGPNPETR